MYKVIIGKYRFLNNFILGLYTQGLLWYYRSFSILQQEQSIYSTRCLNDLYIICKATVYFLRKEIRCVTYFAHLLRLLFSPHRSFSQ